MPPLNIAVGTEVEIAGEDETSQTLRYRFGQWRLVVIEAIEHDLAYVCLIDRPLKDGAGGVVDRVTFLAERLAARA